MSPFVNLDALRALAAKNKKPEDPWEPPKLVPDPAPPPNAPKPEPVGYTAATTNPDGTRTYGRRTLAPGAELGTVLFAPAVGVGGNGDSSRIVR